MLQLKEAQFNIKLVLSRWYSKEGLLLKENGQEESIWLIQTEAILQTGTFQTLNTICGQEISNKSFISSNSRKGLYGHGIGLCKKALNLAILNNSTQVFERLLQQFIEKQSTYNMQNDNSTESLENTNSNLTELPENTDSIYNITDPLQHKGRGRHANKRYLSAIENQPSREKKKNKRQCAMCKSWYHDSRNCPVKVSQHNKENS
ncbi:hypothetical protein C2G38_2050981 [Gigaspora rosea]|uniref:Uncharacterized protein n=1 Tax=Gigaspora rosea TaxID=44941 RepID=A0A397TTH6_9GLOM|nr:hypothetical protein C2G38_2050981 [Gigaspora rosea]